MLVLMEPEPGSQEGEGTTGVGGLGIRGGSGGPSRRRGPAESVQEAWGGGVQEEGQQKQSMDEKDTMKHITLYVKF